MKSTYTILPVYAGDVSGACGALYELEGMTVMHDPSGCNSTYNTFDETRWYEKESLIFLTGLNDVDAVMGNDDKLIRDVMETARALSPRFIALVNSPIPYLNGTDFPGICRLLEKRLGIPAFYIPTNGMHDYTRGASLAFEQVAERLVEDADVRRPGAVNILGMTPLDFAADTSARSLRGILEEGGFTVRSNWALDTDPEEIVRSGEAAVNLVVSAAGLGAAEALNRRFGTPFVVGTPVGAFAPKVLEALERSMADGRNRTPHLSLRREGEPLRTLVGESVVMTSLAAAVELETGETTRVLCPTELHRGILGPMDLSVEGEEAMKEALSGAKDILADPMYRYVAPETARFRELPHLAFSGRMYRRRYPDLFGEEISGIL